MTVLDIWNRSLARIGVRSNLVSVDEDSTEAFHVGSWYDILRQNLLRAAHWGFAREQVSLTQTGTLSDGTGFYPFLYKYSLPSDYIAMRYVLPPAPDGTITVALVPRRDCRFLIQADATVSPRVKVLLSNVQSAVGVYTADVTEVTLWDANFEQTLSLALSSRMAAVLKKDINLSEALITRAEQLLLKAQAADANEAVTIVDYQPDWIRARGGFQSETNCWGSYYQNYSTMNWGD